MTLLKQSLELVIFACLSTFSFKFVIFKMTLVFQSLRPVYSILTLSLVVDEISSVVWAIREDVGTLSLGFSMLEVPSVVVAIVLVHVAKSMRPLLLC